MKGNEKIIEALNKTLTAELSAINQYFIHAEMDENWGYAKLHDFIKKQSIDEMKHAEIAMARILFLEGTPNMSPALKINVGKNVEEMMKNDLALELEAVKMYNEFAKLSADAGDNGSRDLFVQFLKDEETHVDWLEAQIDQIKQVGLQNYLSTKI